MRHYSMIRVGLGLVVSVCLITCSDKTTIVQNILPTDQVKISGQLLAWRCWVGDVWNNSGVDHRFGVETKDTASIIILYANGWRDTVLTDSLSRFERLTGKGLHKIIVETRYTWPDTFQIYFDRDTAIDLKIVYDVYIPDTIAITFIYDSAADSLGASREWDALRRLNGRLHGALNTYGFEPVLSWSRLHQWSYRLYVSWSVPLPNRKDNVLSVSKLAEEIVAADTLHAISPVPLEIYPKGVYLCLD